jgi:hypothetical protein
VVTHQTDFKKIEIYRLRKSIGSQKVCYVFHHLKEREAGIYGIFWSRIKLYFTYRDT